VVSTIRYGDITNEYNEGANCFRNYLRYAEAVSQADLTSAQRVLNGISRWRESPSDVGRAATDAVVDQLAAALRSHGYVVDQNVGQSHFRVDLAVRRPTDAAYCLGIVVDTHASYEQSDPLERDMLRPRLLRAFSWRPECVLAKDWYEDPDKELQRLLHACSADAAPTTEDEVLEESHGDEDPEASPLSNSEDGELPADLPSEAGEADGLNRGDHPSDEVPVAPIVAAASDVVTAELAEEVTSSNLRLEHQEGKSNKFWEIRVHGSQHTVRFGRIGSNGQSQTKSFDSETAAQRDADRLIAEKRRKGYRDSPQAS
jgi:predicted DNA-binding WGR domain protein